MNYFGICYDRDYVIHEYMCCSVILHPYAKRKLKDNESHKLVFIGKINVNPLWMRMNELNPGDTLWLTGTEEGLVITVGEFHSTV
jgi:hypothetical protein